MDAFELVAPAVRMAGDPYDGFVDLASGAREALLAFLTAGDIDVDPEERALAQWAMWSLTGSERWEGADGMTRRSPSHARMTAISVAGVDYRWGADAPAITAADILASRPRQKAS